MSATTQTFPKAFAVWFKDLERWDYSFYHNVSWQWPEEFIIPVRQVLSRKQEIVDKAIDVTTIPIIEKITFGGKVSVTNAEQRKGYKGRLFWANTGDFIYSKIRAKQGSLAVVPKDISRLAVSAEYPIYAINKEMCDGDYIALVLKSKSFLNLLVGLSHGGSTKTRIPPERFEELEIPLPPLTIQQAIVARWQEAKEDVNASEERIEKLKAETDARFFAELGLKHIQQGENPKAFAVLWKDFLRWSVGYNQQAQSGQDITQGKFPVVELGSVLQYVQYGTSEKANINGNGTTVIRMNNIVDGVLDLSKLKHIALPNDELERLLLKQGDILFNRTNSKELVGKCAVFNIEGDFIFASYLIRLRAEASKAMPEFLAYVINSSIGRRQIDALSRQIIGQANVNTEELRSLQIPLPPLDMQREIMRRVEEGRADIAREREAAARRAREAETEVEALILGTKKIETAH